MFECFSPIPADKSSVAQAIEDSFLGLWGESGAADAAPKLLECDEKARRGIMRCSHTSVDRLIAAMALCTRVGDQPAHLRVLGVSGTITKARSKFA